jgi:hypothetical protein
VSVIDPDPRRQEGQNAGVLAGATGVIGAPSCRSCWGLARGDGDDPLDTACRQLAAVGADPVVCHQLTALPARLDWGDPNVFDANNRVPTEGTRVLVDAALAAGAGRVVAQSVTFV